MKLGDLDENEITTLVVTYCIHGEDENKHPRHDKLYAFIEETGGRLDKTTSTLFFNKAKLKKYTMKNIIFKLQELMNKKGDEFFVMKFEYHILFGICRYRDGKNLNNTEDKEWFN